MPQSERYRQCRQCGRTTLHWREPLPIPVSMPLTRYWLIPFIVGYNLAVARWKCFRADDHGAKPG